MSKTENSTRVASHQPASLSDKDLGDVTGGSGQPIYLVLSNGTDLASSSQAGVAEPTSGGRVGSGR